MELEELIDSSGLGQEEVLELVELVALKSDNDGGGSRLSFVSHCLIQARRAARLRDTLGLTIPGMALALTHLARMERLERRPRELESGRPR